MGSGLTQRDIRMAPLDSMDKLRPFIAPQADEWLPAISPNGRLLAYVTTESGRSEVYVRPLAGGGRIQVSVDGGSEPQWSRDGRELFYRGNSHMIASQLTEQPELAVQRRDTLFQDVYLQSSHRLLKEESSRPKPYVVVNWSEELRQKMRSR